jgi:hypothetical protein
MRLNVMTFCDGTSVRRTFFRLSILALIFLIIWILFQYNSQLPICKDNLLSHVTKHSSSESIPTIARVLYLFLCENQYEVDSYKKSLPSITADVMFFCWKENCLDTNFTKFSSLYTAEWSGPVKGHVPLVKLDPALDYIMIEFRVFIFNERQLNLTSKTTWTTARNLLFEKALAEERRQGWRWAYFNFGDGDIQMTCPLAQKLLSTSQINGDEIVFAQQFRSLINIQQTLWSKNSTNECFILIDAFLLSVSPAIGVIAGMGSPILLPGLLTQVVYHVDAMFNAFHRDALPFILPYCARYDTRNWWTSQAILIYRSLCLYQHAIQFNAVHAVQRKHRKYPRNGNPWIMDQDMNLVPPSLIPLRNFLKQLQNVSPLILQNYGGWSLDMTSDECRNRHTSVDPLSCKVIGQRNTTMI